ARSSTRRARSTARRTTTSSRRCCSTPPRRAASSARTCARCRAPASTTAAASPCCGDARERVGALASLRPLHVVRELGAGDAVPAGRDEREVAVLVLHELAGRGDVVEQAQV